MKRYVPVVLCAVVVFLFGCGKDDRKFTGGIVYSNGPTDSLKINQIQVLASHNSYHQKTDSSVFAFMILADSIGLLPGGYNPREIDYTNLSLTEQFNDYGVRGIELDIWNDPNGGHFYYRQGFNFVNKPPDSHLEELNQPGFKILHIPDFDFNTTNLTFLSALDEIKDWSMAHPNHLPIFINIETEEQTVADVAPMFTSLTHAIPFDATAADNMDVAIKSVFGENLDMVITPDKVRGNYSTLEEAVLAGNWPQLAKARGKIVFAMQGPAEHIYKSGHPSLQGRAMFVYSNPGTPEAAFVILNDAVSDFADIQHRVAQGYIVRTRADEATNEARAGDYSTMNAAFNGWAQIISTDYYRPDYRAGTAGWTNYHVQFPNNDLARIDSIAAPTQLTLGPIKE